MVQSDGWVFREAIPAVEILQQDHEEDAPDLVLVTGKVRFLVELKLVRGPRIPEVEGQLARSLLQLQRWSGEQKGMPVVVVALSRFGSRLEQAIRDFMEKFAPGVGWGLFDELGHSVLEIPELDLSWSRAAAFPDRGGRIAEQGDRQLFTDLNRWMLKVLLLAEAPRELWGGPRQKPRHPSQLAAISRVSIAKAHNFARAFEARGFLRKSREGLRLTRVEEMLQAWLQDERNARPVVVPVRTLVPHDQKPDGEVPLPSSAWEVVAVGGASAALKQGLFRGGGQPAPLVHSGVPFVDVYEDWLLEECDPRDAQMMFSRPLFRQSVFRGRVVRKDGPPIVDLWQIALDSVYTGIRGTEQAEYIVERVLTLQEPE